MGIFPRDSLAQFSRVAQRAAFLKTRSYFVAVKRSKRFRCLCIEKKTSTCENSAMFDR